MSNCKGNVLLYILFAVALLAALSYAVTRDGSGQQQNQLTDAQTKLMASELIQHAVAAEQAVYQMTQWGVDYDEIKFDKPGTAGYSTDVTKQIYHPSGGGLGVFDETNGHFGIYTTNAVYGWEGISRTNVEWTPTSSIDVMFSAVDVPDNICQEINNQLHGLNSITNSSGTLNLYRHFSNYSGSVNDFENSDCAPCVNIVNYCFKRPSESGFGELNVFYNIIGSR